MSWDINYYVPASFWYLATISTIKTKLLKNHRSFFKISNAYTTVWHLFLNSNKFKMLT